MAQPKTGVAMAIALVAVAFLGASANAQAMATPPEVCAGGPGADGCQVRVEDCEWHPHVRFGSCVCYDLVRPAPVQTFEVSESVEVCPIDEGFLERPTVQWTASESATFLAEEDLVCLGWGNGEEIYCNARVYQCGSFVGYCVWVCGTGQEEYKPCRLTPAGLALLDASSSYAVGVPGANLDPGASIHQPSEDLLCLGWGSGEKITCILRIYECGSFVGYCVWTCTMGPEDYPCRLTPASSALVNFAGADGVVHATDPARASLQPGDDLFCLGWGDGEYIRCYVEAYACGGSLGYCIRSCPYNPHVYGPPCPVILARR